jgi:hypothetical protein
VRSGTSGSGTRFSRARGMVTQDGLIKILAPSLEKFRCNFSQSAITHYCITAAPRTDNGITQAFTLVKAMMWCQRSPNRHRRTVFLHAKLTILAKVGETLNAKDFFASRHFTDIVYTVCCIVKDWFYDFYLVIIKNQILKYPFWDISVTQINDGNTTC